MDKRVVTLRAPFFFVIYSLSSTVLSVPASSSSSYIGCYIEGGPQGRLFTGLHADFHSDLTPEKCKSHCFDNGFAYAGTQYSYECFCSKTKPPDDKKTNDTDCNLKCSGDETKTCGGNNRLSVFTTGVPAAPQIASSSPSYIGCYIEGGPQGRLFTGLHTDFPGDLTPNKCKNHCFENGFAYSGTQYSYECFCSKTKPPDDKKATDTDCNLKCSGDDSKTCGGNNRLSVYTTGVPEAPQIVPASSPPSYIGCYIEGGSQGRLFTGLHTDFPGELTPDKCKNHCTENRFAYAGTQYSYECFCSKTKPPDDKKATDTDCNLKCSGDDSKTCGGNNRLSVYTTGVPEAPEIDYGKSQYLGCYMEIQNRLLQGLQLNFPLTLTPNICVKHCYEKGFSYAGTQYSIECFCSKTKPSDSQKSIEGECNLKCSGDESKTCGGNNRLNVYSTGITNTKEEGSTASRPPFTPILATHYTTSQPPLLWLHTSRLQHHHDDEVVLRYLGCFKDFSNGTRLMTGYRQNFPDSLTNQLCVRLCKRKGFYYAGMEYGEECFCDNKKPSFRRFANDEECSKRCEGNYLQSCGGSWRISVFETGMSDSSVPTDAGKYIGCYKDQENPRTLSGHIENFGKGLTPLKCTGLCYSMGFLYSGTQHSKQCFCGDDHPNPNLKVNENECYEPCSGNPAEICGGEYRNSIRETGITDVPVDNKYLGCFNDKNNRIFKDVGLKFNFHKTNTPRRCMNFCWQLGYRYSGVEFGRECFCGNEEPDPDLVVSGEECSTPCSGDALESCGSNWRLAVYLTNFSASVVPLSRPTPKPCISSDTVVNGRQACKGDVVFEDLFNSPLGNRWKHVVKIGDAPDHEFAVFHADAKNCFTSKNRLIIRPSVYEDGHVQTGSLELKGCTGKPGTRQCGFQAFSFNILPPVASARIHTRDSFNFRYGIIEIRAKLPVGDWLVPELWLEPTNHYYGPDYASGRIQIAMSRGNQELQCQGEDLSYNHLESGVVMGPPNSVRRRSIPTTLPENWHDHFHNYTLVWSPESISFKIDNELKKMLVPADGRRLCDIIGFAREEGLIWSSGSNIAPFDRDFHISLGLSAGNAWDFPDGCVNRGKPKPWKNLAVKAMLNFWLDRSNWQPTWSEEKSALYIEHVRVTAL